MNKKYLAYVVGAVAIALLVFLLATGKKEAEKQYKTQVPVELTEQQRAEIEKNITVTEGKLEASKKQNVPDQEVFNLYMQLGSYEYSRGNLIGARDAYLKAGELNPKGAGVWAGLFPVYRDMGDLDGAEGALKKTLSLNSKDWNIWRAYIDFEQYQRQASIDQLNKIYQDALEGTHTDINIVTVYAQFLEEQKHDLQSALNLWKIALLQQPNNQLFKDEIKRLEDLIKKQP